MPAAKERPTPLLLAALFLLSVAAALAASEALVRGLDRLGVRLRLREGLLGLLTALGADAPEISSAILSMHAGAGDLGVGVVLGSNIFNLAALLGLGSIVAGHVRVRRVGLALNGGVVTFVTVVAALLVSGHLAPTFALALMVVVFVPYVALLAASPARVARWRLPRPFARALALATSEIGHEGKTEHESAVRKSQASLTRASFLVGGGLVVIVLASDGMVETALRLAAIWKTPNAIVGAVLLAGLTSLPNAYAAIRLAMQHRGNAVVSEAFNSNTINLLAGLTLPAVVLGAAPRGGDPFDTIWLLALNAITVGLLAGRRGLDRIGGTVIVALYAAFLVLRLVT